jgi:hypothetical protein
MRLRIPNFNTPYSVHFVPTSELRVSMNCDPGVSMFFGNPRGKTLQGFLLWVGMKPIPDGWPLWKKIPAFVVVYD